MTVVNCPLVSKVDDLKTLFVGETWKGSSARSLRETMAELSDLWIDDIGEGHYAPKGRSLVVRGANCLLRSTLAHIRDFVLRRKEDGRK